MKRILPLGLFIFISSFFFGVHALAASYYVTEITTSDANPELAQSMKSLIETAVQNAGGNLASSDKDADYSLRTNLVKLGQAYVLTVTKMKDGSVVYSSRQKAVTVEELDDAADRAVRAAILTKPTKQDLRVGEVKPREEDELRRRILSRHAVYLGFGPGSFSNMGTSKLAYNLAVGYLWEVTPNAIIKIMGDAVASSDAKTYIAIGELGMNYCFTDESTSPYFGAALGAGGSAASSSSRATSIGGFAGSLAAGLQFFRTSSTQLDLSLNYSTIFGNNTIGSPGFFSGRIAILF